VEIGIDLWEEILDDRPLLSHGRGQALPRLHKARVLKFWNRVSPSVLECLRVLLIAINSLEVI
jgi:hypothetical protein